MLSSTIKAEVSGSEVLSASYNKLKLLQCHIQNNFAKFNY